MANKTSGRQSDLIASMYGKDIPNTTSKLAAMREEADLQTKILVACQHHFKMTWTKKKLKCSLFGLANLKFNTAPYDLDKYKAVK